jgi:hypothetical protein
MAGQGSELLLAADDSSESSDGQEGASAAELYGSAGAACQPLSLVSQNDGGNVIVGLSGLAKLGLKLDPAKRTVFGIHRKYSIINMSSM